MYPSELTDKYPALKKIQSEKELSQKFFDGDLEFVKQFAMSSPENLEYSLTTGFDKSAYEGRMEVLTFLLTSNQIPKNADIHRNNEYALAMNAFFGRLDNVRYLLTSTELKEHAHIGGNHALIYAAECNGICMVEYLCESDELKEHSDINAAPQTKCNNAFMAACQHNSLDVVRYLARRKDLSRERALYTLNNDAKDGFMLACENYSEDTELIDFIVLEMAYEPIQRHRDYLRESSTQLCLYAQKLINSRELDSRLKSSLVHKSKSHVKKI